MAVANIFHLKDGSTILAGRVSQFAKERSIPRCKGSLLHEDECVCELEVYSEVMFDPSPPRTVDTPRAVTVSKKLDLKSAEVQKGGYVLVLHMNET